MRSDIIDRTHEFDTILQATLRGVLGELTAKPARPDESRLDIVGQRDGL